VHEGESSVSHRNKSLLDMLQSTKVSVCQEKLTPRRQRGGHIRRVILTFL